MIFKGQNSIKREKEKNQKKERKMLRNLDNLINMVVFEISNSKIDFENYTDLGKLKLIQFYLMCEEAIEQSEIDSEP